MSLLNTCYIRFTPTLKTTKTAAIGIFVMFGCLLTPLSADDQKEKSLMQCYESSLKCDAIVIKGNYFRAAKAIYEQDLEQELSKLNGNSDEAKYLSDIDNYDFYIEPNESHFIIGVGPTLRPGAPDYFGGLHYELDAKTFKIIKKWQSK